VPKVNAGASHHGGSSSPFVAIQLSHGAGAFFQWEVEMPAKKKKQQAADSGKGAAKPKPKKKTSRGK